MILCLIHYTLQCKLVGSSVPRSCLGTQSLVILLSKHSISREKRMQEFIPTFLSFSLQSNTDCLCIQNGSPNLDAREMKSYKPMMKKITWHLVNPVLCWPQLYSFQILVFQSQVYRIFTSSNRFPTHTRTHVSYMHRGFVKLNQFGIIS